MSPIITVRRWRPRGCRCHCRLSIGGVRLAESSRYEYPKRGLHDLIAALDWVSDIVAFGGDPSRIVCHVRVGGADNALHLAPRHPCRASWLG